jgi:hypothetical protein
MLIVAACLLALLMAVQQTVEAREPYFTRTSSSANDSSATATASATSDKIVILPVIGKNLIKIIEKHRFFQWENRFFIRIVSNLSQRPYSSSPRIATRWTSPSSSRCSGR